MIDWNGNVRSWMAERANSRRDFKRSSRRSEQGLVDRLIGLSQMSHPSGVRTQFDARKTWGEFLKLETNSILSNAHSSSDPSSVLFVRAWRALCSHTRQTHSSSQSISVYRFLTMFAFIYFDRTGAPIKKVNKWLRLVRRSKHRTGTVCSAAGRSGLKGKARFSLLWGARFA